MAHDYDFRQGNVGIILRPRFVDKAGVAVDISDYSTAQRIIVVTPRDDETVKAAAFNTDGIDGKLVYTIVAADTAAPKTKGEYRFIGQVEKPTGEIIDAQPIILKVG